MFDSMTFRRTTVAIGVVLLAGTAVAAPARADKPAPAPAGPAVPAGAVPGGFRSWHELIAVQRRMNDTAERVVALRGDGFAGLVAAPENRKVLLYWKGRVPSSVRALANRRGAGVPVRILPARHTETELLAAARSLSGRPGVTSAAPKADGSGVRVTVDGSTAWAGPSAVPADVAVPVSVETGGRPDLMVDRQNDTRPYWGGARYRLGDGSCSTGFSVLVAGASAMVTAGHCGSDGQTAVAGGVPGGAMGPTYGDDNGRDTMLINTPSGTRIYTGPDNSGTSIAVRSARPSFVGNWVCTSGASSGEHCGVQVKQINVTVLNIFPAVYAEHWAQLCAAAPGDSGGPVHAYHGDGRTDAMGTITAGVRDTACPGASPTGSWRLWYVDVVQTLGHYRARYGSAEIVTG